MNPGEVIAEIKNLIEPIRKAHGDMSRSDLIAQLLTSSSVMIDLDDQELIDYEALRIVFLTLEMADRNRGILQFKRGDNDGRS